MWRTRVRAPGGVRQGQLGVSVLGPHLHLPMQVPSLSLPQVLGLLDGMTMSAPRGN